MKEEILESALKRLKRIVKSCPGPKSMQQTNLQLDWNTQLYLFVKLQLKAERQWKLAELSREPTASFETQKSRKALALTIAMAGGWGTWVMKRILRQEVEYIRSGKLPVPRQGKHSKIASWLTDEGTMLAMREYMSVAGEGKA